ncbi:MAG: phosphatase PAP2 family protein [Clostridia bacterium]|nr:phosphatase PAP2 family protein [Clostridia bacterium]
MENNKYSVSIIGAIVIIAISLSGLIIGSLLDLQIEQALYSSGNFFGLFFGITGMLPAYLPLGWIAGLLVAVTLKKDYSLIIKIILYILSGGMGLAAVLLLGSELISIDAFNIPDMLYVGILVSSVLVAGCAIFGYFIGKKCENPNILAIIIIFAVMYLIIWVAPGRILKSFFHRPRYRALLSGVSGLNIESGYVNWWERFTSYDIFANSVSADEFKSFPSGHAGAGVLFAMFLAFLPYFTGKYSKINIWLQPVGILWALLVSLSRITVGAHYLSDVSVGMLIVAIGYLAACFVVNKKFSVLSNT